MSTGTQFARPVLRSSCRSAQHREHRDLVPAGPGCAAGEETGGAAGRHLWDHGMRDRDRNPRVGLRNDQASMCGGGNAAIVSPIHTVKQCPGAYPTPFAFRSRSLSPQIGFR